MLIDRKVERYVESVVIFVPASMRARAARDVTDMVNDMIRDYAAGREPDILDARAVIKVLGSPEEIALTWMAANEERKLEKGSEAGILSGLDLPVISFLSQAKMQRRPHTDPTECLVSLFYRKSQVDYLLLHDR